MLICGVCIKDLKHAAVCKEWRTHPCLINSFLWVDPSQTIILRRSSLAADCSRERWNPTTSSCLWVHWGCSLAKEVMVVLVLEAFCELLVPDFLLSSWGWEMHRAEFGTRALETFRKEIPWFWKVCCWRFGRLLSGGGGWLSSARALVGIQRWRR